MFQLIRSDEESQWQSTCAVSMLKRRAIRSKNWPGQAAGKKGQERGLIPTTCNYATLQAARPRPLTGRRQLIYQVVSALRGPFFAADALFLRPGHFIYSKWSATLCNASRCPREMPATGRISTAEYFVHRTLYWQLASEMRRQHSTSSVSHFLRNPPSLPSPPTFMRGCLCLLICSMLHYSIHAPYES